MPKFSISNLVCLIFQSFADDSIVEFEVDPEEPDALMVKSRIGDVVAWRKFERQISSSRFSERKTSSPF